VKEICLAFFLIAFTFVTCKNDDATPSGPVDLVTFTAEAGFINYSDIWLVAWDDNGALLDFGKYVPGQPLTLTTSAEINNKFTLGYFRYRNVGNSLFYFGSIFTDLAPGAVINRQATNPRSTDTFEVSMSNELRAADFYSSTKNGDVDYEYASDTYQFAIDPNASKYLISYFSRVSGYIDIDEVKADDVFELDVNDVKPFETSQLNMPAGASDLTMNFHGFEPSQPLSATYGYALDYSTIKTPGLSYSLRYTPWMTKFALNLSLSYDDSYASYSKYGSLPATVNWPEAGKVTVNSFDPYSLSVSTSIEPEYLVANYLYFGTNYVYSLIVQSPRLAPKIGQLPAEILTALPGFAINSGYDGRSSVQVVVKGSQSYQDNVTEYFAENVGESETMRIGITKN
jgi:hypothetical protein